MPNRKQIIRLLAMPSAMLPQIAQTKCSILAIFKAKFVARDVTLIGYLPQVNYLIVPQLELLL